MYAITLSVCYFFLLVSLPLSEGLVLNRRLIRHHSLALAAPKSLSGASGKVACKLCKGSGGVNCATCKGSVRTTDCVFNTNTEVL